MVVGIDAVVVATVVIVTVVVVTVVVVTVDDVFVVDVATTVAAVSEQVNRPIERSATTTFTPSRLVQGGSWSDR